MRKPVINILNSLTKVSIDTFQNRVMMQKLAYLAQELGADITFTYNWYAKGPYSPSLTRLLYSAQEQGSLSEKKPNLTDNDGVAVNKVKNLLRKDIKNVNKVELIASVWYLFPKTSMTKKEKSSIIRRIKEQKPAYESKEISQTIERIIEFRENLVLA